MYIKDAMRIAGFYDSFLDSNTQRKRVNQMMERKLDEMESSTCTIPIPSIQTHVTTPVSILTKDTLSSPLSMP